MRKRRALRAVRKIARTPERRRRWAKKVYRLSGILSKVKTWQRCYQVSGKDEHGRPNFVLSGWRWGEWSLSLKLLDLSMQLDWDHWDHWAVEHPYCGIGDQCDQCGGCACNANSWMDAG